MKRPFALTLAAAMLSCAVARADAPHSYRYDVSYDSITIDQTRGTTTGEPDGDIATLVARTNDPSGKPVVIVEAVSQPFITSSRVSYDCTAGQCGGKPVTTNLEVQPSQSLQLVSDIEDISQVTIADPGWDSLLVGLGSTFAYVTAIILVATSAVDGPIGATMAGIVLAEATAIGDVLYVTQPGPSTCMGSVSNGDLPIISAGDLYDLTNTPDQSTVFTLSQDGSLNPNCGPLPHATVRIRVTRGQQTDLEGNSGPANFHYVPLAGANAEAWTGTWLDDQSPARITVQLGTNIAGAPASASESVSWTNSNLAPRQVLDIIGADPLQPLTHPIAATSAQPTIALGHHVSVSEAELNGFPVLSEFDDNRLAIGMQSIPAYTGEILYSPPPTTSGGGGSSGPGGGLGGGHVKPTVVAPRATTVTQPPTPADTIALMSNVTLQLNAAYNDQGQFCGNRVRYVRTDLNGKIVTDAMLTAQAVIH